RRLTEFSPQRCCRVGEVSERPGVGFGINRFGRDVNRAGQLANCAEMPDDPLVDVQAARAGGAGSHEDRVNPVEAGADLQSEPKSATRLPGRWFGSSLDYQCRERAQDVVIDPRLGGVSAE